MLPKITKTDLLGSKAKISKGEGGALSRSITVDNNKSIGTVSKRTHPGFNELNGILSSEAHAKTLEGFGGRVVLPLLVVTTVARPALDDWTLVVPNINAKLVHAADESGVLIIGPLLVKRLLAH